MQNRFLLGLGVLALLSPAASAQTSASSVSNLSSSIFKLMGGVGGAPAQAPAATQAPGTAPKSAVRPEALNFKVSAAQRQQALKEFVALVNEKSPDLAGDLNTGFGTTDVFAQMEKEERKLFGPDISVNNLADVWATYWGYAWLVSRGRTDDLTAKQMQGLRAQFRTLLLSIPDVARQPDLKKQQMSDPLTLQVLLFSILGEAWKDHPEFLTQFGNELAQGSSSLGFDLTKLELTDSGFVVQK